MSKFIHFSSILVAASLIGCMEAPPDYGAFPETDDDVTAVVTKDEATATAQIALEGLDTMDFDRWSVGWDDSLRAAITAEGWRPYADRLEDEYGDLIALEETRLNAAETEGFVRFSFLAEFDAGALMLVHVYPADGTEIVGVHIRDAETGEVPESLQ